MLDTWRLAEIPHKVTFWVAVYDEGSKSLRLSLVVMVYPESMMTRKSSEVMGIEFKVSGPWRAEQQKEYLSLRMKRKELNEEQKI